MAVHLENNGLVSILTTLIGLTTSIISLFFGARAPLNPVLRRLVGWYISVQPKLLRLGYRGVVILGGLTFLIIGNCLIYLTSRWIAHLLSKDVYFPGYVQGIGGTVAFAFSSAVSAATYRFSFPKKEKLIASNSTPPSRTTPNAGDPPMMSFTTEVTLDNRTEDIVTLQADASWKLGRLIGMRLQQGYRLVVMKTPRKQPSGKYLYQAVVARTTD